MDKRSATESQQRAVAARGNVLVMAGAGTGKTHTLVERCLDCIGNERAALDEILVVTFTEAAAAEMKRRLRRVLEERSRDNPGDPHYDEQLALFDVAHIGTLHSFCFKLVREHFYELGLDPQPAVLDEGEARMLAAETLEEEFQERYEGRDKFAVSVQRLIQTYGGARDDKIRSLVLRLHQYAQTRPDAEGWLAGQLAAFSADEPVAWRTWLLEAVQAWREEWLPVLENLESGNEKAAELAGILQKPPKSFSRSAAADVLEQITAADNNWPKKRKGILREPLADLFDEAKFLASVARTNTDNDPLMEDWNWTHNHMTALLRLTQNFAARFAARKRDDGVLDFHDLEQFALKLLWDFASDKPTAIADSWRAKLRFVFVDEYQDINAAQDKIIQALSRDESYSPSPRPSGERVGVRGSEFEKDLLPPHPAPLLQGGERDETLNPCNRFLVGDVKQSIYRFRLADPKIFRDYAKGWRGQSGMTVPLAENFRSRESLLHFVNSFFSLLMREGIGGVNYDAEAELKFGSPDTRADLSLAGDKSPRTELLLRFRKGRGEIPDNDPGELAGLDETEKEARGLAARLIELKNSGHKIWDDEVKIFRDAGWGDMAILLRSPSGKADVFAKEFDRAGIPLSIARGGFYDAREVLDLLSLLQLLDNPLQDVPAIAVLRSPLVGCSLDELAEIRL
ncbi:MAG TPA: UvrD-helicase domain-containing protein, partial [Verrucomicrobiae bacterium]|nr:UvrD-helicase domain-containing protein [Verrucomicrobiae bacterium]